MSPLFNPRSEIWSQHFRYDGPLLVGLTPIGRATIDVLSMNDGFALAARQALIDEGSFRPVF